jgi:hypothetical protein
MRNYSSRLVDISLQLRLHQLQTEEFNITKTLPPFSPLSSPYHYHYQRHQRRQARPRDWPIRPSAFRAAGCRISRKPSLVIIRSAEGFGNVGPDTVIITRRARLYVRFSPPVPPPHLPHWKRNFVLVIFLPQLKPLILHS